MFQGVASQCDQSDKLALSSPFSSVDYSTCEGAYMLMSGLELSCPKQCEDCDDGDDCDNPCAADQPERSPATCGTSACGDFLGSITDAGLETTMTTGFPSCVTHATLSGAAGYGAYGSLGFKMMFQGVASQCGTDFDCEQQIRQCEHMPASLECKHAVLDAAPGDERLQAFRDSPKCVEYAACMDALVYSCSHRDTPSVVKALGKTRARAAICGT